LRYGLHLPLFGPYSEPATVVALARDAEAAGWDGFFTWDHMAPPWHPFAGDAWITLTAVASATSRMRIGPMMTPLARRRPWKVARESVALDRLSGGRLVLGVGLGGSAEEGFGKEFDGLGEEGDPARRAQMLDEALAVITGLWTGDPFTFDGRYYHVHDEQFLPRPLQQPRIPIWVAATWPHHAPMRRAACWDGIFPTLQEGTPDETARRLDEMAAYIRSHRTATTPFEVLRGGETDGDHRVAGASLTARFEAAGATWWIENIVPTRWGTWQDWPLEAMRRRIVQGPPR
jgi:alkanesulfonate monooxygenase SsuD/methylene tetrahydromethanopterin reductase-like flavin-dependent oxidoreductase (luciferase family)